MNLLNSVLTILAVQHKCVLLSINEFTEILKDSSGINFHPITDREILRSGFFGSINGMKVFISKLVAPANLRISDVDSPSTKNENDWGPEISFEEFAKTNEHLMILL